MKDGVSGKLSKEQRAHILSKYFILITKNELSVDFGNEILKFSDLKIIICEKWTLNTLEFVIQARGNDKTQH